jgi:hypothetical protein
MTIQSAGFGKKLRDSVDVDVPEEKCIICALCKLSDIFEARREQAQIRSVRKYILFGFLFSGRETCGT